MTRSPLVALGFCLYLSMAMAAPVGLATDAHAGDMRPKRYLHGRLMCAANVNAELARRGIRGTGSRAARSFLKWGRASPPVPGAVAVYARGRKGGHVAIVSRVTNGRVYVFNPSSRKRRWVEMIYPKRAIAYRVASR